MDPAATSSTPEDEKNSQNSTPDREVDSQQLFSSELIGSTKPTDLFIPSSDRVKSDSSHPSDEWFPGVSKDVVAYIDEVRSKLSEIEPTSLSKAKRENIGSLFSFLWANLALRETQLFEKSPGEPQEEHERDNAIKDLTIRFSSGIEVRIDSILGWGTDGVVFKVYNSSDQESQDPLALKISWQIDRKDYTITPEHNDHVNHILSECETLMMLSDPSIAETFKGKFSFPRLLAREFLFEPDDADSRYTSAALLMDFVPGITLKEYLESVFPQEGNTVELATILYNILSGIESFQEHQIYLREQSLRNFMVAHFPDSIYRLPVFIDFGTTELPEFTAREVPTDTVAFEWSDQYADALRDFNPKPGDSEQFAKFKEIVAEIGRGRPLREAISLLEKFLNEVQT